MRKARRPQDFVPVVESCDVISETTSVISAIVHFKPGVAHARSIKETCKLSLPCRLDYDMEDGSVAANVISSGTNGNGDDLFLTFFFSWEHPELEDGSEEAKRVEESHGRVRTDIPARNSIRTNPVAR